MLNTQTYYFKSVSKFLSCYANDSVDLWTQALHAIRACENWAGAHIIGAGALDAAGGHL